MTEDEMVGWHHWLDRHEFEQVPRVADGQGGLVCTDHGVAKSQTRLITEQQPHKILVIRGTAGEGRENI